MKKVATLILIAMITILSGCSKLGSAEASTIYVDKKGRIESITVEALPAEQYNKEELKTMIDESIDDYNGKQEEEKITLESFKVKKDQARLTMKYASYEDYEDFNGRILFAGTVAEAKVAGYEITTTYTDASIIITNEPVQIKTPKDIVETSENASIIDEKLAVVEGEGGATENGIIFENSKVAYVIYGENKEK